MHFIGIDGGGTKTKTILTEDNLSIIRSISGPASNPLAVGFENSSNIIIALIKKLLSKTRIDQPVYVVAGIAGCGSKKNADKLTKLIKKKIASKKIQVKKLKIVSDAEIALEGPLNGKPGTVLICGTGSVLIGKNSEGKFIKIGGFGKLIGDEGSGYSIGKKGLQAISKYIDGRGSDTILAKSISKKFGIRDRESFILKVHSDEFDVAEIAAHVISAAQKGDKLCKEIIDNEIEEILLHIKSLKRFLGKRNIPLCFAGGVLNNKNFYSEELKNRIGKKFGKINFITSKYPPEYGAVILANKLFNQN